VVLACEPTACCSCSRSPVRGRRWEPTRLRLRLFSTAGRLAASGRRVVVHLSRTGAWSGLLVAMLTQLCALPVPDG
jgi:hypothetical protein